MGREMVTNKLIGEKSVLSTAAYAARFNEMEAVAALLDGIDLDERRKALVPVRYGDRLSVSAHYDDHAANTARALLEELGCPTELFGKGRVCHVLYRLK